VNVALAKARKLREERAVARRNGTLPRTNGHQAPSIFMAGAPMATLPGALFKTAAETFLTNYEKSVSAKEARRARNLIETYTGSIAALPVTGITADHVATVLQPIWKGQGSNVGSRLRVLIERTLDANDIAPNPASWIRLKNRLFVPKEQEQTPTNLAAVPWQEAPAVYAQFGDTVPARVLKFIVLTAARLNMVLGARWKEIDLEKREWTCPAERMKGKPGKRKPHTTPLSDAAIAVLGKPGKPDALIFPAASGVVMHHKFPTDVLRLKAGRPETIHGFRSTFTDWAAEAGYPSELRELALAHLVGDDVERRYRRTGLVEPRRPMMQAWADYLTAV
jgi:integrase